MLKRFLHPILSGLKKLQAYIRHLFKLILVVNFIGNNYMQAQWELGNQMLTLRH